jgi:hypothetical protein
VYLVFVALATLFWLLNELGKDYTTTIKYPVRFSNLPKNRVLVSELPKQLTLNVSGYGYTLLRYKISPAAFPVVIDMHNYSTQVNNPGIKRFSLQTRYEKETFNNQLSNAITVNDILPDTVIFQFANIVEKKVPIKPDVTLQFEQQCMLDGNITFSPDSVIVEGPHIILDTLQGVFTKHQRFKKLNKPLQRNMALEDIKHLRFKKKRVVMKLPVATFTEASMKVELKATNVPDSIDMKMFPRFAEVSYLVSMNHFHAIEPSDFRLEVDFGNIEQSIGDKLPVKIGFAPSQVKNVRFSPVNVEYILEKK